MRQSANGGCVTGVRITSCVIRCMQGTFSLCLGSRWSFTICGPISCSWCRLPTCTMRSLTWKKNGCADGLEKTIENTENRKSHGFFQHYKISNKQSARLDPSDGGLHGRRSMNRAVAGSRELLSLKHTKEFCCAAGRSTGRIRWCGWRSLDLSV